MKLSSQVVAVVIGTHVCSVARLPLTIVTSRLEQWEVVDKVIDNGARGLDHCDVIASLAPRAEQSWHSNPNVIYGNSLEPNTSRVLHMDSKHRYQTQQWQCSIDFQEQDDRNARFSESCAARFSVKMSRIGEFRVTTGIMTELPGRCLWITLGLRAKGYVKGFWLHHSPWALGYFTNNARAAPVIIP